MFEITSIAIIKTFEIMGNAIRSSVIPYMINNNKTVADPNTQARLVSRGIAQVARDLGSKVGPIESIVAGTVAGILRPYIHQDINNSLSKSCKSVQLGFDQGMYQLVDTVGFPLIVARPVIEASQIQLDKLCNGHSDIMGSIYHGKHMTVIMTTNFVVHEITNFAIGPVYSELIDIAIFTVLYDHSLTTLQKASTLGLGTAIAGLTYSAGLTVLSSAGAGLMATAGIYCGFKGFDKCTEQASEIVKAAATAFDIVWHLPESLMGVLEASNS